MFKKVSSILSILFFLSATLPFIFGLSLWGNGIYAFIINISFGVLSLFFACLGIKGKTRLRLASLSVVSLLLWLFLLFIGMYGFQQP